MDKTTLIGKKVKLKSPLEVGSFVTIGTEKPELPVTIGSHSLIRSHCVIYGGVTIGEHFQSGHGALIREGTIIGDNVSIGSHSVIEHHVIIGNNVRIHSNVFIPEFTKLEDDAWIGPGVVMTNAKYPRSKNVKKNLEGPIIKKGAKIGANVTILPAVIIGEFALIGAGAVVTKNVKKRSVVVGNPAIKINTLSKLPYV